MLIQARNIIGEIRVSPTKSLLTLHFYCFYIYSLRLYQVWIYGLGEFWNLFRGLKYNPLKKRVDTIYEEFDTLRFILGAMIFSIFLFLFPTVLVFYLVFTTMRLACRLITFIVSIPSSLLHSPTKSKNQPGLLVTIITGQNV